MDIPRTRYARTVDGVHVAYQVLGDGPDLVVSQGWISNVDLQWSVPAARSFFERLASFSRVIVFDKRGVGLSDRGIGWPTLEERMDDLRAVLEAVDSERAHLLGESEGGPMSLLFAASFPERTTSLILYGTMARTLWAEDYPAGVTEEALEAFAQQIEQSWGSEDARAVMEVWQPSGLDDIAFQSALQYMRQSASPREAADALRRNAQIDVRDVLEAITCPTLVLHRRGDAVIPPEAGRYLATRIPGARHEELAGDAHNLFVQADETVDAIEEWITGDLAPPATEPDRVLATVLFTDIVGSTERAVEVGDRRWREILDEHDATVRAQLERFRGQHVKDTGDGLLARFDGPARAVRCAQAILESLRHRGIEARAGVHAGELELRGDDIGGVAVHIAARVSALAGPGEVLVSRTVRDLVAGSGLAFDDRGTHDLKGIPETWQLFAFSA